MTVLQLHIRLASDSRESIVCLRLHWMSATHQPAVWQDGQSGEGRVVSAISQPDGSTSTRYLYHPPPPPVPPLPLTPHPPATSTTMRHPGKWWVPRATATWEDLFLISKFPRLSPAPLRPTRQIYTWIYSTAYSAVFSADIYIYTYRKIFYSFQHNSEKTFIYHKIFNSILSRFQYGHLLYIHEYVPPYIEQCSV
jgi:hypothetical protein